MGPDRAHVRRAARRGLIGALVGAVLGGAVGAAAGAVSFGTLGPEVACTLAGVIAGGGLGAFIGGMTGLESPEPGHEPSETDRPILDVPELTDTEHDDPEPRGSGATGTPRGHGA